MSDLKLLVPIVFLLSLVCFIASDPIPQTSATGDEKKEVGLKPQVPAEAPSKKSIATTDKSTEAIGAGSTSSPHVCGGLKGFLNLCHEKKENSSKQKRSLNENEENSEEPDINPEKEVEETHKNRQKEKRDIPMTVAPSGETEMEKWQTEANQEDQDEEGKEIVPNDEMPSTLTPALDKREAPLLDATPPANLRSGKSPAPVSSETYLPILRKRQAKESEEDDDTDETNETDDGVHDDDDDDNDGDDETEKR